MWKSQGERVLIDKDTYHFAIEEFRRNEDQMVFVHLTVWKWTPSVFKEILRNWAIFRSNVACPIYAVGGDVVEKTWEAFVSRLGFKFLTDAICENGTARRLFVHFKTKEENEFNIHCNKQPDCHRLQHQPE